MLHVDFPELYTRSRKRSHRRNDTERRKQGWRRHASDGCATFSTAARDVSQGLAWGGMRCKSKVSARSRNWTESASLILTDELQKAKN